MTGEGGIGEFEIAAVGDELTLPGSLGNIKAPRGILRQIRRRLRRAFKRGGELVGVTAPWLDDQPATTWAAVRQIRTEELVGPIRASDLTFILEAKPLIDAGYKDGLMASVEVQRFPIVAPKGGFDEEPMTPRTYTAIEEPALLAINGVPLFWRGIFRG